MSWTNAVITDAGHALQAALLGTGKGLVFTRAVSGAGLAAGDLAAQTAVTDARQELTMQPAAPLEDAKTRVQAMLSNAGLEAGYTMHQLGFYAKAQDGADEILYALVQDEAGDPIPSAVENPGFTADWTYIFAYGSADSVTVTVDPAGVVPWSAVGAPGGVAPLDESGKVPKVHLPDMAFLPLSGGTMTGDINMGSNKLINLAAPSSANDAARKADVDAVKTILTSLSVTGSFSVNRTAAYDAHTINLGFRPRMVVIYAGINTDAASIPVITMDAGMNTGIRIITDAYSGQFGKLTSTGFQATFYAQNNYNDTMTVYYIAFR